MTDKRMVGKQAPRFELDAILPDQSFGKVSLEMIMKEDKWTLLFFYPMNFSTVCPTEIIAFSDAYDSFKELNTEIVGISTDTIHSHKAWTSMDRDNKGIGSLAYPLAADPSHHVSKEYGVLVEEEGINLRGLYIISPVGELLYAQVNHHDIGRSIPHTLMTLQALQTDGLCPANWQPGDETL
ncbi:peroxiredoxin [Salisediminibacterium beveridgei]|uniref:Alkyl hydroperoxide reductase subunit C-like protein n=1 Tax=Salisediminibacterium beveridgei TaxID=632773 RepID=A0A1D7QU90_9BACI|nr:peroxiredoxin [Salisediminibacterium beveridgei]AOM82545.1 Alkyl hydroperoxide reductase subunit C-like protein [Salisediminibacterium beveridgei]